LGKNAGETSQQFQAVALGSQAGQVNQGTGSIAIGVQAGQFNQGSNSIAIGALAGSTGQSPNTIVLNATNQPLQTTGSTGGFYVKPIQQQNNENYLVYNSSSGEVTYSPVSLLNGVRAYGSFFDTTTQTGGSSTGMRYNTTDISNMVYIQNDVDGNPTLIRFNQVGVYNIQFSAQLKQVSGGGGSTQTINIWLKKNGSDVLWSDTKVVIKSNGDYVVAAWNFFGTVTQITDYFQIYWNAPDTIFLVAEPSTSPGIPSVILTVNQVN
jgi:hypothetical protein